MPADPARWYEIQAAFCVHALDGEEDTAIDAIANAVRYRPDGIHAKIFPVGSFNARPCEDPTAAPGHGPTVKRAT